MPEADYSISWPQKLPDYVKRHQYPRRWSAARHAVRDLYNDKKTGILKIALEDKRAADLCKSAIYSEGAKIRQDGDPTFKTLVTTHITESGRVELFVERNGA